LIEKDTALEVVHESVAWLPDETDDGLAESVHAGPPPPPPLLPTVTVTEQVTTCPVGLVTVPVKVVSAVIAFDATDPPTAGVTAPMPWSMEKVSALVVCHVSVV
jgi:hypothetical protein